MARRGQHQGKGRLGGELGGAAQGRGGGGGGGQRGGGGGRPREGVGN